MKRKLTMNELKKLGFTPKDLLLLNEQRRMFGSYVGLKIWLISAVLIFTGMIYTDKNMLALGLIFLMITYLVQYVNKIRSEEYSDEVIKYAFKKVKKC